MKKNYQMVVIVVLAVATLGVCAYTLVKMDSKIPGSAPSASVDAEFERTYMKSQVEQWLSNEMLPVNDVTVIRGVDTAGMKTLSEMVKDGPVLIYRASGKMCTSCIQFGWEKIKECFPDAGKNPRIVMLTSDFTGSERRALYNNECYSVVGEKENLGLPIEATYIPFMCVLDGSMKAANVFIPEARQPMYADKYLDNIKRRVFGK